MTRSDIWTGAGNVVSSAHWLSDVPAILAHFKSDCFFFLRMTAAGSAIDILKHPTDTDKPSKSILLYQPHVPTANGTAGYADVRKWWDMHQQYNAARGVW